LICPSSEGVIDLSSDSEDDIIDLYSDNEENSDFRSGRADDLDYEDPDNDFNQPRVSLNTSDQNSLEQPISLEGAAAKSEHFNALSGSPSDSAHVNGQYMDDPEALYACNVKNRILPLLLTNGAAANSEHSYIP
jgi:hypothetical protein